MATRRTVKYPDPGDGKPSALMRRRYRGLMRAVAAGEKLIPLEETLAKIGYRPRDSVRKRQTASRST